MIRQVTPINSNNLNTYAAFKTNSATPYPVTTVSVNNEKEKKSNRVGLKIAISATAVGLAVLALTKGLPSGARNKIDTYFRKIEDKIIGSENKQLTQIQKKYLSILKKVRSGGDYIKAFYNTAPLKDVLAKKSFEKIPVLKKFSTWVTNLFEKVSVKTSTRAYKKTTAKFNEMYKTYETVNKSLLSKDASKMVTIEGKTQSVKAWVSELERKTGNVQANYRKGFGDEAQLERLGSVKNDFKGVDDKVWERTYGNLKGFVKDKKSYQTFISEELVAPVKYKNTKKVTGLRTSITNDFNDNYRETMKIVREIDKYIEPTDKQSRILVKDIKRILTDEQKALGGEQERAQRLALNAVLSKKLNELSSHVIASGKYDKNITQSLADYVGSLRQVLNGNKKGEMQEILTIYKHLLPPNEYANIKQSTYRSVRSLDKSIDLEADKLFDKLRDLEIGAAPMDSLGLLSSVGIVGLGMAGTENKQERVSVSLKYGIPAIGAVATTLYCTMGLVSGGASLLFGTLSGLVINKIGVALDKHIKERNLV